MKKQVVAKALPGAGKSHHPHDVVFTKKYAKEEAKETAHKKGAKHGTKRG